MVDVVATPESGGAADELEGGDDGTGVTVAAEAAAAALEYCCISKTAASSNC